MVFILFGQCEGVALPVFRVLLLEEIVTAVAVALVEVGSSFSPKKVSALRVMQVLCLISCSLGQRTNLIGLHFAYPQNENNNNFFVILARSHG